MATDTPGTRKSPAGTLVRKTKICRRRDKVNFCGVASDTPGVRKSPCGTLAHIRKSICRHRDKIKSGSCHSWGQKGLHCLTRGRGRVKRWRLLLRPAGGTLLLFQFSSSSSLLPLFWLNPVGSHAPACEAWPGALGCAPWRALGALLALGTSFLGRVGVCVFVRGCFRWACVRFAGVGFGGVLRFGRCLACVPWCSASSLWFCWVCAVLVRRLGLCVRGPWPCAAPVASRSVAFPLLGRRAAAFVLVGACLSCVVRVAPGAFFALWRSPRASGLALAPSVWCFLLSLLPLLPCAASMEGGNKDEEVG